MSEPGRLLADPWINLLLTELRLSCLPDDHVDAELFAVRVVWRGPGDRYAVAHLSSVLDVDGEWDWEPIPSSRTAEFKERTRFSYLDALRRAGDVIDSVVVNGKTWRDVA